MSCAVVHTMQKMLSFYSWVLMQRGVATRVCQYAHMLAQFFSKLFQVNSVMDNFSPLLTSPCGGAWVGRKGVIPRSGEGQGLQYPPIYGLLPSASLSGLGPRLP